jgi:hypothetical protein
MFWPAIFLVGAAQLNENYTLRSAMAAVDRAVNEPTAIPYRPQASVVESIDALLVDRGLVHGDFTEDATLAQGLKDLMHGSRNWPTIDAAKREALEHICTKLARLLVGDSNHADSWRDLQGYARLVEQRLP